MRSTRPWPTRAFEPLRLDVARGGALVTDAKGDIWSSEFIVNPAELTY